ncbi:unnamed protein product [Coccothraustes coccothraustes]
MIAIPDELRFSPSETEESGHPVGAVPPGPREPEGDGTGKAAESERGVEGGSEGSRETLSRGGRGCAAAAVVASGGSAEAVGDTSFGANFARAAPGAAAVSAGAVPETRARGGTGGTSGKGSQITASTSDVGSKLGAAAEFQAASVGRHRRRAEMMQDPEVGARHSARIAERMQAQAG